MLRLSTAERVRVVAALVEDNSIRATVSMTGAAKNTVAKLLVEFGAVQDGTLRALPCKRIQCDEIWSFIYAKQKNVQRAKAAPQDAGDVWTWTAIDADTKLVPCWALGTRDAGTAHEFISDLASRLANRVQLTTDGHKVYVNAVEDAFGADIDFAQLVKLYGAERPGEARYSPAAFVSCQKAASPAARTRTTSPRRSWSARTSLCG